jgi:hypothetical protein
MKLRYMIEYALRDRIRNPRYEPIGVWAQGPGPGLDLVIEFLPGNADADEDAQWVVNRLVEAGLVEPRGERKGRTWHLSAATYRRLGQPAAYVRQRGFEPLQQEQMVLQSV